MLPSFCNDTITVKRAALKDSRGTKVYDWANAVSKTLGGCSVQPTSTSRDFDGRTTHRIEWNSLTFEINGAVMPWKSPTGRVSHVWARLAEWRG